MPAQGQRPEQGGGPSHVQDMRLAIVVLVVVVVFVVRLHHLVVALVHVGVAHLLVLGLGVQKVRRHLRGTNCNMGQRE